MEHIASCECHINFHGCSPAMGTEGASGHLKDKTKPDG